MWPSGKAGACNTPIPGSSPGTVSIIERKEPLMEKKNYQIVIKIPFEALDDIDARHWVESNVKNDPLYKDVKLQEVYTDKPPRGLYCSLIK